MARVGPCTSALQGSPEADSSGCVSSPPMRYRASLYKAAAEHGLEIVMAVCRSFALHREPVGKRITAAVVLADDPGGHRGRPPVVTGMVCSWPHRVRADGCAVDRGDVGRVAVASAPRAALPAMRGRTFPVAPAGGHGPPGVPRRHARGPVWPPAAPGGRRAASRPVCGLRRPRTPSFANVCRRRSSSVQSASSQQDQSQG